MSSRERAINLIPGSPLGNTTEQLTVAGELLACVYRERITDQIMVTISVRGFSFILAAGCSCKRAAVGLVREFVAVMGYTGKVLWKTTATGPITEEPRL